MDYTVLVDALQLVVAVSWPVLAAVLAGAVIAGVLRVATQIDDPVISFIGRLCAAAVLGYFAAAHYAGEVAGFATRVWGGADFYY